MIIRDHPHIVHAEPVKPSDFGIRSIEELRPGEPVVLWCRVSSRTQNHNGNLDDMEANLRWEVERRGGIVVGVSRYVNSGITPLIPFLQAANKAHNLRAKLVAESVPRFIRHPDFHSKRNPDAQAGLDELRSLRYWSEGVVLMTVVDPDATPSEVRSYQCQRGQHMKGNKGGRTTEKAGYTKQLHLLPEVLRLHRLGYGYRKIAKQTGVPKSTVRNWIRVHSLRVPIFPDMEACALH